MNYQPTLFNLANEHTVLYSFDWIIQIKTKHHYIFHYPAFNTLHTVCIQSTLKSRIFSDRFYAPYTIYNLHTNYTVHRWSINSSSVHHFVFDNLKSISSYIENNSEDPKCNQNEATNKAKHDALQENSHIFLENHRSRLSFYNSYILWSWHLL